MKYNQETVTKIDAEHINGLANRADCSARTEEAESFLHLIRITVLEQVSEIDAGDWQREMVEDYSGRAHQIADGAPDVYTHTMWEEFVGTAAWTVEIDYEEQAESSMEDRARVRLYEIARILVNSLASEIADSLIDEYEEVTV